MSLRHTTSARKPPRAVLATTLALVILTGSLPGGAGQAAGQDVSANGACRASIGGVVLGDATVRVGKDDSVAIEGRALPGSTNVVSLAFAGIPFEVERVRAGDDGRWSVPIDVSDYALWGVGLYNVVWHSSAAGEAACTISGAVEVQGSFFGSRVGWASVFTFALTLPLLLTLGWKTTINPRGRWKLKLSASGKVSRDDQGRLRLRWSYAVAQTLVGTLLGLLLAGATFATLAGIAASPPSVELALELGIPLTLIGFLLGLGRLRPPRERAAGPTVAAGGRALESAGAPS
jgi:hypothetical protein